MTQRSAKRKRGITLIELLVSMTMMVFLVAAVTYSFVAGLDMQRTHARRRVQDDISLKLEARITRLLQGARLTDDAPQVTTFFVGENEATRSNADEGCDRLTFTTTAPSVPQALAANEDDFETQAEQHDPQGGFAEVSLSTTSVGNAGNRTGLFLRMQRPSDTDYTEGGFESVLEPNVASIGFLFWDGSEWTDSWDTSTGQRRLPAAVKVTYRLQGSAKDDVRVFVVPIPTSDVDDDNPLSGVSAS